MKSKEEFEAFVVDLTELEMTDLLESCSEAVRRNKWGSLRQEIAEYFDSDRVAELEDEVHELEESKETMRSKLKEIISDLEDI